MIWSEFCNDLFSAQLYLEYYSLSWMLYTILRHKSLHSKFIQQQTFCSKINRIEWLIFDFFFSFRNSSHFSLLLWSQPQALMFRTCANIFHHSNNQAKQRQHRPHQTNTFHQPPAHNHPTNIRIKPNQPLPHSTTKPAMNINTHKLA